MIKSKEPKVPKPKGRPLGSKNKHPTAKKAPRVLKSVMNGPVDVSTMYTAAELNDIPILEIVQLKQLLSAVILNKTTPVRDLTIAIRLLHFILKDEKDSNGQTQNDIVGFDVVEYED